MPQTPLHKLKNIGKKTEPWLHEVGVRTREDLEAIGSVETYKRLKQQYPNKISLLALYALEGALWGIHWNMLPKEVKEKLKNEAAN